MSVVDQGSGGTASRSATNADTWQATALDASDNVAMLLVPVAAGQDVIVNVAGDMTTITALEPIALGHKIALADLRPGDAVTKYGECVGEATQPIARGAWVHIHNLRSRRARDDDAIAAFDAHAYLDSAAAAVQLRIPSASRDAVAANLARLYALAREVLSFDA